MGRLLERDTELETLERVAHEVLAGRGRLVLVSGEAGIGKTSLVNALRERLEGSVAMLVGACEPLSVPAPLAPIRELVEAAGSPELGWEEPDRIRLARSVLDVLEQRAPVVAVIEDAHWADPTTVDVVRLLARRLEQRPVALVVTYRDDELRSNPALAQLVGDFVTGQGVERVGLAPLSTAAVRDLAQQAGVDADRLRTVTGGNPFLVFESIAAGEELPTSVRDAVLARAGRLSDAAREAVEAAAVLGQRSSPAVLDQVAPDSGPGVEEALARGVLVSDGAVLGFRHELVREALESALSPHRRAQLHARVVRALESQHGEPDYARLAHHAELAGLSVAACGYAAQAAYEARRLGALREAALQSERALRLGAGLSASERLALLVLRSRTTNFASVRLQDAVEAAEEAIALAVKLGDPVGHGRSLIALSYALWSLDRVEQAKAAAREAVAVLEQAGDLAELARARATDIRIEATSFDPRAAVAAAPAALELAQSAGLAETRIDVAISLGLARGHLGDADGLVVLRDACRAARAAGLSIQTVRSYVNRVVVAVLLREHELVDALAEEALQLFDQYQTRIPANAVELYRARSFLDRGRWAEARRTAMRTDRDWVSEKALAMMIEALVDARSGANDGRELLERAWNELRGVPENARHGALRVALVEGAWLRGDRTTALRVLEAAQASEATLRFARPGGEVALWAYRYGLDFEVPAGAPAPAQMELEGDWRGAIQAWEELQAPYEAALAALPGDDRAAREALGRLRRLGADGAVRAFVREREASGTRALRGPRRSTLAHPAGLTRREQQVLELMATGATNHAIAGALTLSERTVAHHVSAILGKLGARNRVAAVRQARASGLIAQDGQPGEQR